MKKIDCCFFSNNKAMKIPLRYILLLTCFVSADFATTGFTNTTSEENRQLEVSSEEFDDKNTFSSNNVLSLFYSNIVKSAKYAAISYCTKHDNIITGRLQEACPCTLCTETDKEVIVEKIYRGKVSGVIFRDVTNSELILALKGTTSNDEWLIDFKILPIPYHFLNNRKRSWKKFVVLNKKCKGCTVHKGFYDGAREIYDNMFEDLCELIDAYPDYKLSIVGHSLGGAIAPFIANEFLLLGKNPILTTFGSPKFGNKIFAKWMDNIWQTNEHYKDIDALNAAPAYIRVSHRGDVVPLLPTRQIGYKHSGVDVFFTVSEVPMLAENIKLRKSPTEFLPSAAQISITKVKNKKQFDAAVDSHRVYIVRMNQCVTKRHVFF